MPDGTDGATEAAPFCSPIRTMGRSVGPETTFPGLNNPPIFTSPDENFFVYTFFVPTLSTTVSDWVQEESQVGI